MGKKREEVSRQSNEILLSRTNTISSKGIEANCIGPIDKPKKMDNKEIQTEDDSTIEEKVRKTDNAENNKKEPSKEEDNESMRQKLKNGIITKATFCNMEEVEAVENDVKPRHLHSALETVSVLNKAMIDITNSEAKDQIAEHDRSMDPGVGLESPNWFYGMFLAAGQVGGAESNPAYSQYLVQSHLNTTSVIQSALENIKNGFRHREGDHQHRQQSVQFCEGTSHTNSGTAQRFILTDDGHDPVVHGDCGDDILRLRSILFAEAPEEYGRQEGGGAPILCDTGPVHRRPGHQVQTPRRGDGRSLRRVERGEEEALHQDRVLGQGQVGGHQDDGHAKRVLELATKIGERIWNLKN